MITFDILWQMFKWTYLLWFFYLAIMNLKRSKDLGTLTPTARFLGTPIFIVGYTLDILVNLIVLSVIMFEFPKIFDDRPFLKREWLVTARLKRFKDDPGYRGKVARWFERNLLGPFDPSGSHI